MARYAYRITYEVWKPTVVLADSWEEAIAKAEIIETSYSRDNTRRGDASAITCIEFLGPVKED